MGNLRKLRGSSRKLRGRRKRPHPRYWPMPAFRISIIHSYLTSKSTNSIPTCFAEARAVFAEAILQKILAKKWHGGSSRKQIFRGRIRGSCGCVRGSYAEGFAEARPCFFWPFGNRKRHQSHLLAKTRFQGRPNPQGSLPSNGPQGVFFFQQPTYPIVPGMS